MSLIVSPAITRSKSAAQRSRCSGWTLLLWATALFASRATGLAYGLSVPVIVTADMLLSALAATICGLTLRRPYVWCGVAFALGAALAVTGTLPAPMAWIGSLVVAFSAALLAEFWISAKARRQSERSDSPGPCAGLAETSRLPSSS